jgi:curved DNA-binding protein
MELVHYKILELAKTATESEIKKSYRGLARKYHPDLSPDDKYGKEWKHADEFEKQGYGSSNQQHYNKQNQSSGNTEDFYDSSSRCMVLMAVETVKENLKDRISMQNCI